MVEVRVLVNLEGLSSMVVTKTYSMSKIYIFQVNILTMNGTLLSFCEDFYKI
jgi:hypothetical protein